MNSSSILGSDVSIQKKTLNTLPILLTFLQKPEFQHLRSEFEKILDGYLQKSSEISEEEIPGLIHDTTEDFKMILEKAIAVTRCTTSWEKD